MDFFTGAKRNSVIAFIYKLPLVVKTYHFIVSILGACIYGFPSRKIYVIGVTGTKGKTTTLELLNSILESAGEKTAMISSVRVKVGGQGKSNDTDNTMPGRFFIQRFLRRAVDSRCTVALVEVTSQGAALFRHRFIEWDIGVITNIEPEHTEAHGSFEAYRDSKLAFLTYVLKKRGTVFINKSDNNSQFFINVLKNEKVVVLYSRESANMQNLLARPGISKKPTNLPPEFILSDFNKDNIASAEAVARYLKITENVVEDGVRNFSGVPGRMEFVWRGSKTVVIDYAHTPESLEAVYKALKLLSQESWAKSHGSVASPALICVLGSAGGGRDKWKRPVLGKIAAQYCSTVILTSEDPYDEDPNQILSEIKSGISPPKAPARPSGGDPPLAENNQPVRTDVHPGGFSTSNVEEILDRGEAIRRAVSYAKDGDIVVITGKGSEQWIHGPHGAKIPWSERKAVDDALRL